MFQDFFININIKKIHWFHGTPHNIEECLFLFKDGFKDNSAFSNDFHVAAYFASRKPNYPKIDFPIVIQLKPIPFSYIKYAWGEKNKKIINIKTYAIPIFYIKKFIILDNRNKKIKHYLIKKIGEIFL